MSQQSPNRIYLDNNATTKIDPVVKQVLLDQLDLMPLNASSIHSEGQQAKTILAHARRDLAHALEIKNSEIVFTSGSTEGLNMLLRGAAEAFYKKHKRPMCILSTEIEHACVYETLKVLKEEGEIELTYLPVNEFGAPKLENLEEACKQGLDLMAFSAANSETGVKINLEEFAACAQRYGALFVVDATALSGKESVQLPEGVSAAAFSSHKFHGPMGCGFCMVRSDFPLFSQSTGGGQEFKRRSGTENIPSIVSMVKAFDIAQSAYEAYARMNELRAYLEGEILSRCPGSRINGTGPRLVNTSNIYFPNVEGDSLLLNLDLEGLSVSLGSACATGTLEPSRVLLKMGLAPEVTRASVRFSLSRMTTSDEVEKAAQIVSRVYSRLAKR